MPWVEKRSNPRPVRSREFLPGSRIDQSIHLSVQVLAAFQAAGLRGLLTQGIGLRPQPWAKVSRPVGPAGQATRVIVDASHRTDQESFARHSEEPQRGESIEPGVRAKRRPRVTSPQDFPSPEGATAIYHGM